MRKYCRFCHKYFLIYVIHVRIVRHTSHPAPASALLDALPGPVVLIDLNYRILAANERYCSRYGGLEGATQTPRCYQVSHHHDQPRDVAGETCPMKNSLTSGHPQRILHIHYTPRREKHVDVETFPIRSDAGQITYFLEVLRPSGVASARAEAGGLMGRSRASNGMLELIERVASSDTSVLLLGESGTARSWRPRPSMTPAPGPPLAPAPGRQ